MSNVSGAPCLTSFVMPLKQDPLAQQAADLAILYELNFVRAEDVVSWADCLTVSTRFEIRHGFGAWSA
jgi:hypothetical protein